MKLWSYSKNERGDKMLTILFLICLLWIFGKLFLFGIKATWGILKILLTVILIPVILVGMVIAGIIYIAFPILIVIGIVSFVVSRS